MEENDDFKCDFCNDTGIEVCNNPDHGLIEGMGGEISRLGCPLCDGTGKMYKENKCYECGINKI